MVMVFLDSWGLVIGWEVGGWWHGWAMDERLSLDGWGVGAKGRIDLSGCDGAGKR